MSGSSPTIRVLAKLRAMFQNIITQPSDLGRGAECSAVPILAGQERPFHPKHAAIALTGEACRPPSIEKPWYAMLHHQHAFSLSTF